MKIESYDLPHTGSVTLIASGTGEGILFQADGWITQEGPLETRLYRLGAYDPDFYTSEDVTFVFSEDPLAIVVRIFKKFRHYHPSYTGASQ